MRPIVSAVAAIAFAAWMPSSVLAQANPHAGPGAHAGHAAPAPKAIADLASVKAYQAANDKMHKDMSIAFSGNADVDFVRGMIPHHQGAIDMAKVVLEHGKDRRIRRLAREIIKAQEAEIRMMQAWLKRNEGTR